MLPPPATKSAFSATISACRNPAHLRQTHALLLVTGLSIKNSLLTAIFLRLLHGGAAIYGRAIFNSMAHPRPFHYNTLIRFYSMDNNNDPSDSLSVFAAMRRRSVRPDEFTFPHVFRACAVLLDATFGTAAHALLVKHGLARLRRVALTELASMYARIDMDDGAAAERAFDEIDGGVRDVIAWNAVISTLAQSGRADRAIALFRRLDACNAAAAPDELTFASVLSACAQLGFLLLGKQIHDNIVSRKLLPNVILENALIDMYAKCGLMENAYSVFDEMKHRRNLVSWSTVIGGYAINGDSCRALETYSRMQDEGVRPNGVTMLAVLAACGHAGLVSEGEEYFRSIACPGLEHYTAMVDLLGRSGRLTEAYRLVRKMPMEPDAAVWGALLGACTIHRNTKLGQVAADKVLRLAPDTSSYRVLLSNIYALAGRWDRVEQVRQRMRVKKVAAYSSVELRDEVYIFYEGSNSGSKDLYLKLDELMVGIRALGYASETSVALHDMEGEEREVALQMHSERLALAFSLIKLRIGDTIRIMKNIRICSDCHNFFKYVSIAERREIVVRDKSRFHHFRDGTCSCRDFW